jgi:glycosyltransferase involved in cell wall biosynthesis
MKIALIGTRGIPASHGGFETCVEEIGQRLAQKGHNVWVYSKKTDLNKCSRHYKGMTIVTVPRMNIKGFETLFSTIISVFHSLFYRFDLHMVFNGANSPALFIYKILKLKYVLNTDGLEWKRDKWGFLGKNYYKLSERISVLLCNNLISDSKGIHDYYKKRYNADSTIIAYGADIPPVYSDDKVNPILDKLGISKNNYLLQVTRFEPENYPLLTLRAFNLIKSDCKCLLIGGANFRSLYLDKIENEGRKNKNIILPGFIYHKEHLEIISQNAFCYIHGNSVGGTNPALLQAMAAGRPVIALDCIFNRETLGENGFFYKRNEHDLSNKICYIFEHSQVAEGKAQKAIEIIRLKYNWDLITNQYESLFMKITN